MSKIHNLDESVEESFDFILKGHTYRFRQLNSEEMQKLLDLKDDNEAAEKYLYTFIDKVDPKSPDFTEIAKKMIAPQLKKFNEMIKTEMNPS